MSQTLAGHPATSQLVVAQIAISALDAAIEELPTPHLTENLADLGKADIRYFTSPCTIKNTFMI